MMSKRRINDSIMLSTIDFVYTCNLCIKVLQHLHALEENCPSRALQLSREFSRYTLFERIDDGCSFVLDTILFRCVQEL